MPDDLATLSDEEVLRLAGAPSTPDVSKLPDDELLRIAGAAPAAERKPPYFEDFDVDPPFGAGIDNRPVERTSESDVVTGPPTPEPFMRRVAKSPFGQAVIRASDAQNAGLAKIGESARRLTDALPSARPGGDVTGRPTDVLGGAAGMGAGAAQILFAPVSEAVSGMTGADPFREESKGGALDLADLAARRLARAAVDVVPATAQGVTHLPGVKQALEFAGGENAPEDVGTLLPFALPLAKPAMNAVADLVERPGAPRVAAPEHVGMSTPDADPLPPEKPRIRVKGSVRPAAPDFSQASDAEVLAAAGVEKPLVRVVGPGRLAKAAQAAPEAAGAAPSDAGPASPADGGAQSPAPQTKRPMPFRGRPMSSEAGALVIPNVGRPLPDVLPPGTAAERDAVAGVKERIRFGDEPKPPVLDRAADLAKKTQSEFVRREAPLRRAEVAMAGAEEPTGPTAQAKFAQGSSSVAAENVVKRGLLDEKDVPSVEKALKDVVKSGRRASDVSAYAAAKRAIADYDPNKLESGFDPAEAQATVDLYEKNHPAVVKAADAMAEVNRALRSNLAEADRWNPARLAEMEKRNTYPIEFARDFGDAAEADAAQPGRRGGPFPGPKVKARTGGKQPIRDPLVRFQENVRRWIAGADQARVKHAFLDLVDADPAKAAPYVERLTPAQLKAQIPDFDAIAAAVNPATAVEDFTKTFDAYDRAYKAGIIPDGKGGFLRVKDPALANALKGGDYEAANALAKIAQGVTAIQRTGITQVSPSFLPRNFLRDVGTYVAQAKNPNDFKVWTNLARGLGHAIRGELENVGVKGTAVNEVARRARLEGFFKADTTKNAPTDLARMEEGLAGYYLRRPHKVPFGVAKGVFETWKSLNSGVEHAPRYAALIDELDRMGWKPGQPLTRDMLVRAGNAAQESTVNFRLGGDTGKAVNRYVFNFFNPAVQGVEQLRQSFADRPVQTTRRALTYGVAPAVGMYLYWQSDPKRKAAWDRMTPWRRAQMNIPLTDEKGNVRVLSLPVAQEAGAIYSATTAALDAMHGQGDMAAKEAGEIWNRAAPGPLGRPGDWMSWVPSAAQPAVEVGADRFAFSGRPVNPRNMEGGERVAPQEVRQPYSSKLGYVVSKFLFEHGAGNLTTAQIDALISGYGGTAARDVLRTAPGGEKEAADTPMFGGFFPRASESRFVDAYYDLRATFEGHENLSRALRKRDPKVAASLRLPSSAEGAVRGIDGALKAAMDRYRNAPASERPEIAARMDALAKKGTSLLEKLGVGKPRVPWKPKEPADSGR